MEQDENHEKGPRWSWARNHMGNVRLKVYEKTNFTHAVKPHWINPHRIGRTGTGH
jgi:hypothetical protein